MKKRKKIVALLLSLVMAVTFILPISGAEVSAPRTQDQIQAINKINVAKYAISFVDSMYEAQNFEAGNVITLYSENNGISGYCIDIMNGNEHNGYVVVKFSNNEPVVSEYAVESGIKNPYTQIIENSNLSNENLVFYSVGSNEYQILDEQKNVVYGFGKDTISENKFKEYKKEIQVEKQSTQMTIDNGSHKEKVVNYSDLDAGSIISDSFKGSSKSGYTIPVASTMSYYGTAAVKSIGKTYACSVVAVSNMMKYYRQRGFTKIPSSLSAMYSTLWNYAGTNSKGQTQNGNEPKAAKRYLESLGYICSYKSYIYTSYSFFVNDLKNGKPCIFTYGTISNGQQSGHAVFVVGYVETTAYQYLHIADGWNTYLRFINFNGYNYSRRNGWSFSVYK